MRVTASTKHHTVRSLLEDALRDGEFAAGEQLPAEIDLARRYGIAYATVRRAVSDLVAADLLERRPSKGTFVRHGTREKLARVTVNLITTAYEGSNPGAFLMYGVQALEREGWNANVIRLTPGQQDPAIRVIGNGELAIVYLDDIRRSSALALAMKNARGRAVVLPVDFSDMGIPSVLAGPRNEYEVALDRLRAAGHEKIAMAAQVPTAPDQPLAYWQRDVPSILDRLGLGDALIPVPAPLFYSPAEPAYEAVGRWLKQRPETTAIVTQGAEICYGTMAACRDAGRSVPDSLSIVNFGDSALMKLASPAITCVDMGWRQQCDVAIDLLKSALAGETGSADLLRTTELTIVERESIRPLPQQRQP